MALVVVNAEVEEDNEAVVKGGIPFDGANDVTEDITGKELALETWSLSATLLLAGADDFFGIILLGKPNG